MNLPPPSEALIQPANWPYYVFLDEGGNFDFSPKGSKYFTLSAVSTVRPFPCDAALADLRFNLLERDMDLEYFHAAEDKQDVRDQVFAVIARSLQAIRVDALVVEKAKTGPALRPEEAFYPRMLGYLLRYIVNRKPASCGPVIVVTDSLPVNKKREAVEKAVKQALATMLPQGTACKVYHHASKSCPCLQVADYCDWAIFRKWERNDPRSYNYICPAVRSEFDIFHYGTRLYY